MIKDIDFLPTRYRERKTRRRALLYRTAMVACLLGFVVLVAGAQHALQRSVRQQLATVDSRYPLAQAAAAKTAQLQSDLAEMESFATLYTYLDHPWPVTQLMASVARQVPEGVVIAEMTLESFTAAGVPALPPPGPTREAATMAKRELDRLRGVQDATTFAIVVSGTTSDATQLHAFVGSVAPSPLFRAAKLESLEALPAAEAGSSSRFELKLFVRPTLGQSGGQAELDGRRADSNLAAAPASGAPQP